VTYFQALLIILPAFALPAALSFLLSRWTEHQKRSRFHEVGIAVFLQMGVIFAVIVAFVFTNIWDQFEDASNAVNREAADLQNMADRAAYLPPKAAAAVRQALLDYMHSEIQNEWPAMVQRRLNPQTLNAFTNLFAKVAAIRADNSLVSGTRDSLFHLLRDIRDQRQLRLLQIDTNVPEWLWTVMIFFSSILVVFVMGAGIEHSVVHAGLTGIFSAFLATILVTIHLFDYPFEGSIRISSEAISNTVDHIGDIPVIPDESVVGQESP
jgi:hypothetical protein